MPLSLGQAEVLVQSFLRIKVGRTIRPADRHPALNLSQAETFALSPAVIARLEPLIMRAASEARDITAGAMSAGSIQGTSNGDLFANRVPRHRHPEGSSGVALIVGVDEDREMGIVLLMAFVVIAFDGGFLGGSVRPFDLPGGPGMFHLHKAVLDAMSSGRSITMRCDYGIAIDDRSGHQVVAGIPFERLDRSFTEKLTR